MRRRFIGIVLSLVIVLGISAVANATPGGGSNFGPLFGHPPITGNSAPIDFDFELVEVD